MRIKKEFISILNKEIMARKSKRGRDSGTGKFISIEEANRRPKTTTVETVKVGPTKKRKK